LILIIVKMTAANISKYKTLLYDKSGKPIMVQLDLRNKMMKQAYERAMEELEDMLDLEIAEKRLADGEKSIPWSEAKNLISK
jgi:hypothetical protein